MDNKIDIKSLNLEELTGFIVKNGEKAFRAKQVYQWLHVKQVDTFDEMTNLSKAFREKLEQLCYITDLHQEAVQISKIDGTRKYLFLLEDGNVIESVLMRCASLRRWAVVWAAVSVPRPWMDWCEDLSRRKC